MDRPLARRILLIAFVLGVAAEILLDGTGTGINVPLLVAGTLVGGWLVRRRGRAPDRLDAWLPITAVVLAGFVAVRADPFLAVLDTTVAAMFTGASLAAFSGVAITRRSVSVVVGIGLLVTAQAGTGMVGVMRAARTPRSVDAPPRRLPAWVGPMARGLALAIPLVLIFAVLFASADPIFQRGLDDILGLRIDLGELPGRVLFIVAVTWLMGGLLRVAASGLPEVERASLGAAAASRLLVRRSVLGTTEALVILVGVDLVFGLFVGLQVAYLFGGLDTLVAVGMTYSEYARRGYFELVAAAGLAGGLLVTLEYAVGRRSRPYVTLGIVLVTLTVVVLVSAAARLLLYQDAYGWTELRLYVAASIAAMALTLVVLAVALASDLTRWVGHAMVVIGVVALVGLNVMAPAAFVAARNVERVIDPSLVPADGWVGLDLDYLRQLPDDAVPVLVDALPRLPDPDALLVRRHLERRAATLADDPALSSPAAWNLGREQARAALSTLP